MAGSNKIDSNVTGLSYAEEVEDCPGVLPPTPVWIPLEPNTYADFGGEITTVARNPINPSRQRKKGVTTDLDASGGFNSDMTQTNLQDLMQGFFQADFRPKGEVKNGIGLTDITLSVTALGAFFTWVGTPGDFTALTQVGDLILSSGFANPENNGLFRVGAVAATQLDVTLADGTQGAAGVVNEAATATGSIVVVGHEAGTGDIDVDVTGARPALTSTTLDFTTLGLIPGEFIFIGGDQAATQFVTAANNGFARSRLIQANRLEFDKTQDTMVDETGTGLFIQLFFGRVLKNELPPLIKRRSYNFERTLGNDGNGIQSEYLTGAVPNEINAVLGTADKLVTDLTLVAINNETRDGTTGVKLGTRVPLVETDAFNTSSDVSRIKLAIFTEGNANPTPLFAFATDLNININNGITPNKAIGVLGAFDVSSGQFEVGGDITAYFASVDATQAVRDNADITLDVHFVKANTGISYDLPLISLGDGRANVEQDQPITIPLTNAAATGAKIDSTMDHTLMMIFWDYLPDLAD